MIHIGGKSYEIVHEHRTAWNPEMFRDRYSEVLDRYDYIVGDWGYNQLRLKGFFKDNNPKSTKDSALSSVMDYINEYCNFGCAYFILEKKASKDGRAYSGEALDTDAEMEGAATAEDLSDAEIREQGISLVPRQSPPAEDSTDLPDNGQEERISRAERHSRAEHKYRTERSEKQERGGRHGRSDRGNRGDHERGGRVDRGERQERNPRSNRHHRSRNKQHQHEGASSNSKQNNNGSRNVEPQRSVEEVRS